MMVLISDIIFGARTLIVPMFNNNRRNVTGNLIFGFPVTMLNMAMPYRYKYGYSINANIMLFCIRCSIPLYDPQITNKRVTNAPSLLLQSKEQRTVCFQLIINIVSSICIVTM